MAIGSVNRLSFTPVRHSFKMAIISSHREGINLTLHNHDLAYIYGEREYTYVGRWLVFNEKLPHFQYYYDVEFPKSSIRDLSNEDLVKYDHIINGTIGKRLARDPLKMLSD